LQGVLVSAVLTVHLLCMNLASGGPLFCIWLRRGGKEIDDARARAARALAWFAVWALLMGMLTGGGLLLLPQSSALRGAMARFPDRAWSIAGAELLFSAICLCAYAGLGQRAARWRWAHALIALSSTTNLLYHFPPLMSVLGRLATDPSWVEAAVIDRQSFVPLMVRGEVLSLSVHFGLASLAVAAVVLIVLLTRQEALAAQETKLKSCRVAAAVGLLATLAQLPVGIWVLATLPGPARGILMGESPLASILLLASLLTSMILLQGLMKVALGDFDDQHCRRVGWLLIFVVWMMTTTLQLTRSTARVSAARYETGHAIEISRVASP